jgi:UDP-glucose 4-epimerase
MTRVLIVGINGPMGAAISSALLDSGDEVVGFGRGRCRARCSAYWNTEDGFSHLSISILDNIDCIIYLAWPRLTRLSSGEYSSSSALSYELAQSFLNWASPVQGLKIIVASSGGAVYGDYRIPVRETDLPLPNTSYGIEKLAVETLFELHRGSHSLQLIILRIANPYGFNLSSDCQTGFVDIALSRVRAGLPVDLFSNPSTVRDFLHVNDLIQAFRTAIRYSGSEQIFNIGSGIGLSLGAVCKLISNGFDNVCINDRSAHAALIPYSVLDVTRAARTLHWQPAVRLEAWLDAISSQGANSTDPTNGV